MQGNRPTGRCMLSAGPAMGWPDAQRMQKRKRLLLFPRAQPADNQSALPQRLRFHRIGRFPAAPGKQAAAELLLGAAVGLDEQVGRIGNAQTLDEMYTQICSLLSLAGDIRSADSVISVSAGASGATSQIIIFRAIIHTVTNGSLL